MSSLSILWWISGLVAAIALLRRRPASFLCAANQLSTLRSLMLIQLHGQPKSQSFVPGDVFQPHNLEIAAQIFTISTGVLLISIALPSRRQGSTPPRLPAIPRGLLAVIAIFLLLAMASSETILSHGYTDPDRLLFGFNFGGLSMLVDSLVLYEVARRVMTGSMKAISGFGFLFVVFMFTDYLKGSTGLATGYLFCAAILLLGSQGRGVASWLRIGAALAAVVLLALLVRTVRSNLYEKGAQSVVGASRRLWSGQKQESNGDQTAAHVLECITLYDSGNSREWRSIYDPLLYTIEPSFLLRPFGITRPIEAAWELARYFIQGGGIFVLGEFYWNGGLFCVAVMTALLALWCYLIDTRWRLSFGWLMMMCLFTPGLLMGFGYGFAQIFRGLSNGLLVLGVYGVGRQFKWVGRTRGAALRQVVVRPGGNNLSSRTPPGGSITHAG